MQKLRIQNDSIKFKKYIYILMQNKDILMGCKKVNEKTKKKSLKI